MPSGPYRAPQVRHKLPTRQLLWGLLALACGYLGLLDQAWALAPGETWDATARPRSIVLPWQNGYFVVDPKPDNKLQLYFLNSEKKLLPLPYARGVASVEYLVRRTQSQRPSTIPLVASADGLSLETLRPLQAPLKCHVRFALTPMPAAGPETQATVLRTHTDESPQTVYMPRIRLDG
jgi:hypothetical protein